ncbi:MAG: bacillithiol system redox-active protein YtxJ [Acidobacteria bacterium]|nr:bacillithiol system redox-active protein YtxJ [Acidobacteriota bacterium]
MLQECTSYQQFRSLLEQSHETPVIFFKHSLRCPISAGANADVRSFAEHHPDIPCVWLNVVEHKELSRRIATETGIPHQSPQAYIFRNGRIAWDASHGAITLKALTDQLTA